MNSWKCFEMTAPKTFRNNVSERILEKTSVMVCNVLQLHEYFLQPKSSTTGNFHEALRKERISENFQKDFSKTISFSQISLILQACSLDVQAVQSTHL